MNTRNESRAVFAVVAVVALVFTLGMLGKAFHEPGDGFVIPALEATSVLLVVALVTSPYWGWTLLEPDYSTEVSSDE